MTRNSNTKFPVLSSQNQNKHMYKQEHTANISIKSFIINAVGIARTLFSEIYSIGGYNIRTEAFFSEQLPAVLKSQLSIISSILSHSLWLLNFLLNQQGFSRKWRTPESLTRSAKLSVFFKTDNNISTIYWISEMCKNFSVHLHRFIHSVAICIWTHTLRLQIRKLTYQVHIPVVWDHYVLLFH